MNLIRVLEAGASFVYQDPNLIRKIFSLPRFNDEPQLFQYIAYFNDKNTKSFQSASFAIGCSFNKKLALLKLFGEIIERYSLGVYDKKEFVFESYENLKKHSLNPEAIICFSQNEINSLNPKGRYNRQKKLHWVKGYSLLEKKEILIPAQLVFIPYEYDSSEPILRFLTSTGAASGFSFEEVLYRGICEIIERDSFMISYLNKISSCLIKIDFNYDLELFSVLETLKRYKLELFLIDITTDIDVFSVAAIIIDKTGKGPSVSIGLKAGLYKKATLIGAVEEALMIRFWLREKESSTFKNVDLNKQTEVINFWLQNKKEITFENKENKPRDNLKELTDVFKKLDMNVYYVDITTPEARELGFFVIKTIIPSLQPFYHNDNYKYLGSKRLYSTPVRMGALKKPLGEKELNSNKIPL